MPRLPRFDLPGYPPHVVQRGNNPQAVFFDNAGYLACLGWLNQGARQYGVEVHAYFLMTNHVHLLLTPSRPGAVPRLFASIGRHLVTCSPVTGILNSIRCAPLNLYQIPNASVPALGDAVMNVGDPGELSAIAILKGRTTRMEY